MFNELLYLFDVAVSADVNYRYYVSNACVKQYFIFIQQTTT